MSYTSHCLFLLKLHDYINILGVIIMDTFVSIPVNTFILSDYYLSELAPLIPRLMCICFKEKKNIFSKNNKKKEKLLLGIRNFKTFRTTLITFEFPKQLLFFNTFFFRHSSLFHQFILSCNIYLPFDNYNLCLILHVYV